MGSRRHRGKRCRCVTVTIELDDAVYAQVVAIARWEMVSVNTWIVMALEREIERERRARLDTDDRLRRTVRETASRASVTATVLERLVAALVEQDIRVTPTDPVSAPTAAPPATGEHGAPVGETSEGAPQEG